MKKLYWSKVKKEAIIPTKKKENGGFDLYACVEGDIQINPHSMEMIPIGVASSFSSDYVGIVKERGSTGIKNMRVAAGVIDSGFRNEWKVIINNTSDRPILITDLDFQIPNVTVYPKSKAIAQVVFVPLADFDSVEELPYDQLLEIPSERKMGMLGASGK